MMSARFFSPRLVFLPFTKIRPFVKETSSLSWVYLFHLDSSIAGIMNFVTISLSDKLCFSPIKILYHNFSTYEKPLRRFVRDWQVLVDCRVATLLAMTYKKANCKAFCNDLYIATQFCSMQWRLKFWWILGDLAVYYEYDRSN